MRGSGLLIVCSLWALTGCVARWTVFGHSMGGSTPQAAAMITHTAAKKITAVEVTIAASDPGIDRKKLLATLQAQLRAESLLDEAATAEGVPICIVIDDFAIRPSTNAVVFGYVLSTGTLQGALWVSDEKAPVAQIRARAQLTKPAEADPPASLEPLYRRFAELTVRRLTGAAEPVSVNQ